MRKRSHIAYFVLAIVFGTLALREVVLLGIDYGRWAKLLTIALGSAAAGLSIARGVRAWRAKKAEEKIS